MNRDGWVKCKPSLSWCFLASIPRWVSAVVVVLHVGKCPSCSCFCGGECSMGGKSMVFLLYILFYWQMMPLRPEGVWREKGGYSAVPPGWGGGGRDTKVEAKENSGMIEGNMWELVVPKRVSTELKAQSLG